DAGARKHERRMGNNAVRRSCFGGTSQAGWRTLAVYSGPMPTLHDRLAPLVKTWRDAGYPCELFPAIAEVLEWARDPESGHLRFLRAPQLQALETYWYLRLIERTPHILALYQRLFPQP